jgi:predicted nucleotidyltransferase
MNDHTNIVRIKAVYNALGELKDKVVFVGGATVALYADRKTYELRPTDDVDILVEIYTKKEYAELEELLRQKGFQNDTTAKFVGRYKLPGIIVDVMPINEDVLGFSNKWYQEGFTNATDCVIDERCTVKIFTAPYFIASKLEAFKSRGNNDGRTSSDFEDLVYLMENRSTLWGEMKESSALLYKYLKKEFKTLLQSPYLEEWIDSTAGYSSPPMTHYIIDKMKTFIATKKS